MMRIRAMLFAIGITLLAGLSQAQDARGLFILSDAIRSDESGSVSVDFAVRNANGYGVADLTPANLTISEPTENVTLTSAPTLPLTIAFIVDLSRGSDVDLIQQTLRAYFLNVFREGDTATFYILDQRTSAPGVVTITTQQDGLNLVSVLRTTGLFYRSEIALTAALEGLQAAGDIPTRPRHAIYVGSYLTAPRENALGRTFAFNGIPLHVIQAHRTRETDTLRILAENGRGLFVNNRNGLFVLDDPNATPVNTLKLLFDTVEQSRLVYNLRYRSAANTVQTQRAVTLTANLPDGEQVSADYTYEQALQPPTIRFVNVAELDALRRPFRPNNDETLAYDISSRAITVAVNFPDGVERRIDSLRLQVEDAGSGDILQSTLTTSPDLDVNSTAVLVWSLREYQTPNTVTPVIVSVTMTDEIGQTATVSEAGSVRVEPAPPIPTSAPTLPPEPTLDPTAVSIAATAAANPTPPPGAVSLFRREVLLLVILLGIAALALAILAIALVARLRRLQRRALVAATDSPTEAAPPVEDDDAYTTNAGDFAPQAPTEQVKVLAKLRYLSGYDELDIRTRLVEVTEQAFVIGRDEGNHLTIDLPIISPRHCRLRVVGDDISVRDLGSKNGTFVNGEPVRQGRDVRVPVGSELSITKAIVLEVWGPEKQFKPEDLIVDETDLDATATLMNEAVFKPVPGMEYAPDNGRPLDDEYSPI